MEGKSALQSGERTERGHRRRLSSILKTTHSPLNDAGGGNEPSQEPTIEKRQKTSRRVSFAETIRVFTPELQSTGSDDKENEGYGIRNSCANISKEAGDKYGIAGMDTLLHGPIQVPGHNSDWNYAECAKDKTIFFSSDNDMDMTTSNTVTIHGLTEAGTKKIDTKQFLASLKSQNSKEVAKIHDFPLSTGGEKHLDCKGDSSMGNKIKFSDFLARLGGEKSNSTEANDGNKTVLFTCDQQDMDMTRSHTVSIDSKVLSEISKRPNANVLKDQFCEMNNQSRNYSENVSPVSGESQNKTLYLYEQNDMDITRSHTTSIESKILEGVKTTNVTTELQNTKRKSVLDRTSNAVTSGICFQGEDMDITKSNTSFYPVEEASRERCTTLLTDQDDMDMTHSHTIAIKNTFLQGHSQIRRSVPYVQTILKGPAADKTVFEDDMELTKSHTMIIDDLNQLALHNESINLKNITPATCALDNEGIELKMCRNAVTAHVVVKQRLHNETVDQEGEMGMTNVNVGLLQSAGKSQPWKEGNPVYEALQENTMYLCDQDDMDMTRAHTVAIENKEIAEVGHGLLQSNATLSAASVTKSHLKDVKYTAKPHSMLEFEKGYTDEDIDVNVPNTFILDSQKPGNDAQLPGPKSKILSSVSNKSEKKVDKFHKQSRKPLENSPVSGELQDKTLYLYEQNMDITRSHTTAIESKILEGVKAKNVTMEFPNIKRKSVLDQTNNSFDMADDVRYGKIVQGDDMDITKSNTVFIDHELDKPRLKNDHVAEDLLRRKSVSSHQMSLVPSDERILPICDRKQNHSNACLVNRSSVDKTVCNEDMEMTRSHSVAIESKISDGLKAKNVTAELLDTTRKSVLDRTTNVVDMVDYLALGTSFQCEDMDLTKSNTVFIDQISDLTKNKSIHVSDVLSKRKSVSFCPKSLAASDETLLTYNIKQVDAMSHFSESLGNKSSVDKTIFNEDDMEMTRSHTLAIESKILDGIGAKNVTMESLNTKRKSVLKTEDIASRISFQGDDMDITKSNTVYIDQFPDELYNKGVHVLDVSSRPKSLVRSDDGKLVCNMEKTYANAQLSEGLVNKSSVDKIIFNEDDMEMTRSHTLAIESKILGSIKAKNVTMELMNTKQKLQNSVLEADDLTTSRISFQAEDMDFTKSNTVFIDQVSDELYNKDIHITDIFSKRKSVSSRARSLVYSDETLPVYNLKTDAISHFSENHVNKSSVDKTILNEDDMEMTRSHTLSIESKILDIAKAKNVTAFQNTKRKSVLKADDRTSRISFQGEDMDITKSNTVFIDQISDELYNKGDHISDVLSRRKSVSSRPRSLVHSAETLPVYNTKTDAISYFSENLVNKSCVDKTILNEDDMEMTRSHTLPIESKILDGPKAKNVTEIQNTKRKSVLEADDITRKMYFQSEDMDITKSNTVYIDQIPDELYNKGDHISGVLSRRKSVSSCPKSLVPSNERQLLVCNMEKTYANAQPSEGLLNKSSVDRTICNEDDMEMTRSHTLAIESKILDGVKALNVSAELLVATRKSVFDRTTNAVDMADDLASGISFQGKDMDITKANTVFIDQISDELYNKGVHVSDVLSKRKSLSCPKPLVSSDETILLVHNMEETNANVDLTETLVSKSAVNKSVCNEGDMEMTRSHTVAIESKILDAAKSKNVATGFLNTKRESGNLTAIDFDMADDLTSRICFQGEDMDMTKSNTVFIDQMSNLHKKSALVLLGLSNRKSVSFRPKSFVPGNETMLQVCNMEETLSNVHLLENKANVDKNLCNEGDMEMTRSHTVAIENKTFEAADIAYPGKTHTQVSIAMASCDMATARPQGTSNTECAPPSVSTSYQDLSMPIERKDEIMNISVRELSKLQGNSVLAERNKILLLEGDETMSPREQSMDITEAYTAPVEVNFLAHIPSSSIGVIKDYGGKSCEELMEMEPMEKLENCRRKSYARSLSLGVTSGIFLEGLGNGELPHVHTSPVEDVSLLKSGPCNAEADLILDKSKNITVGFIDNRSKENRHMPFRNSISNNMDSKQNPNSGNGVDRKIECFEENGVSGEKSVYEDEVKSELLRAKIEGLNTTCKPVNDSLFCESNHVTSEFRDVTPEEPKDCVPPIETYQKDPEVALEMQLKKSKLKGKRVSFCFPEMETVAKDEMLAQATKSFCFPEKKMVANDGMLEQVIKSVPQQGNQDVEHQDKAVHATEEIKDSALINQASVVGRTENLEDQTLQERDLSIDVLPKGISSELEDIGIPAKLFEESRNKRRSIADVLLSLKSLTQKPKFSPHHTAPVSSLIDQLSATSQILSPSRSVTEKVMVNLELPVKASIQEKELAEKAKISRENCLPSRRSVKMFQPKLPNKRTSRTSNLETVVSSVSETQPQNDQSCKVILKTLHGIDDGQCIEEEMLPDDQEINSMFDYEVPEGAWEELCKKEAFQQNFNVSASQPKDSSTGQKRVHNTEHDSESQREKRGRLDEDEGQTSTAFKTSDKSYRSDSTTPHASKTIEQTCNSSQDSRGDGMSVELSSQQCSQMDSQLPWDSRCEQSLWQNFQDGTITVQEFFVLLGFRILIQKPRYSELPSKRHMIEDPTASEVLLDQYVYHPKLQVYDEECHTLFQAIEELKVSTELQHKPLVQVNSLLWEALRMCSENELMCFGATLKNMKSLYAKKSKLLAHKAKVSTYSKLLRTAQMQKEQLQARLREADQLLRELDGCISSLHMDPIKPDGEFGAENRGAEVQGCTQSEIDGLRFQEEQSIRENLELEERKENLLARLGSLQEEARVIGERLQEPSFTEWELVKWTDHESAFNFLYDSVELSISFGDYIDGEHFNNHPCRRISCITVESQLDEETAPPSTILVHRLISQYVDKSAFHEAYKTQNDLPQLLFDLSLVVSRCKLLGEELETLTRWGAIYNVLKVQVRSQEVSLLFSNLTNLVKFELIIHLSYSYPTAPLPFTLHNRIGSLTKTRVTEIISKVPVGLWYLKRTVKSLHENLLL